MHRFRSIIIASLFIFFFLTVGLSYIQAQDINQDIDRALQSSQCGTLGNQCCNGLTVMKLEMPDFFADLPGPIGLGFSVVAYPITFLANSLLDGINSLSPLIADGFNSWTGDQRCAEGAPSTGIGGNQCICLPKETASLAKMCLPIKDPTEQKACIACSAGGYWSSLGCIDFNLRDFIQYVVFGWGIGIAGGMAFLCIIYSSFRLQTSQGNPEIITKTQEMLTSCITGLIVIIFSVFILRLIGVDILRIPGFS